ncbi:MAG TPA: hypothetical protein VH481_10545 [Nitrososphaeraceae archaeon]
MKKKHTLLRECFSFLRLMRLPFSHISAEFPSEKYHHFIAILFSTADVGSYVCIKIVTRTDQDKFKMMIFIAVIFASMRLILDSIIEFVG